jgi:hypothetical protein
MWCFLTAIKTVIMVSATTALRTMAEFKAIGIVDREEAVVESKSVMQIDLRPEFKWFLSKDFERLKEGFTPTDKKEFLKHDVGKKSSDEVGKEKFPLTHTNFSFFDDDQLETFWCIVDELEQEQYSHLSSTMEVDKKTIGGQELKNHLVSSKKFFIGDAVRIIEDMVTTDKLEKVSFDTYRRIKKDSGKGNS